MLMPKLHKYKLTVEDESRLEKIFQTRFTRFSFIFLFMVVIALAAVAGGVIVAFSPMKTHLPGYLKESERTKSEEQHLRLDSIYHSYEVANAYLENIQKILNPDGPPQDSLALSERRKYGSLSPDSLMPMSKEEKQFSEMMRNRDKYNIAASATAAAETLMFKPVNDESIITEATKNSTKAEVVIAKEATVDAIADGKVITVNKSLKGGGTSEVIIQHPKGFLSRYSLLENVLIEPGDKVTAGQIIANSGSVRGGKSNVINIELWYNGDPLIPYDYIRKITPVSREPLVGKDEGRDKL